MMRKCFLAKDMQIEARNGLNSPLDLDPKIWLIFDQKLELGCQVNGSLLYGCFNACHVFASLKMRSAAGLQEFSDAKWVEWCWDGSVEWHGVDCHWTSVLEAVCPPILGQVTTRPLVRAPRPEDWTQSHILIHFVSFCTWVKCLKSRRPQMHQLWLLSILEAWDAVNLYVLHVGSILLPRRARGVNGS